MGRKGGEAATGMGGGGGQGGEGRGAGKEEESWKGGGRGGERRDREKYSLDSPRVQHVFGHVPLVRLDVHLEDIDKALQSYQHGLYVA